MIYSCSSSISSNASRNWLQGQSGILHEPLLSNDYIDYKDHEGKILYHAANILKCGDTLLYSTPYTDKFVGRGTHTGFKWIKQHVKNVWRDTCSC